jgi:hypothetical protein
MLTKLFALAPTADFAKKLAHDIAKRYPAKLDTEPGKRPSVNRLTRILDDTVAKAQTFQTEHHLSWFGRARLGNSFKWELQEMGYTKELVELATEALLVSLSKTRR